MDDNTTKVVMAIIALISAVVTPLVLVIVTKMQNNKIDKNQIEIVEKVDVYHKEVNGNMAKLLKTTADLATAQEKARGEEGRQKGR
jgi:hypothetical protein